MSNICCCSNGVMPKLWNTTIMTTMMMTVTPTTTETTIEMTMTTKLISNAKSTLNNKRTSYLKQ